MTRSCYRSFHNIILCALPSEPVLKIFRASWTLIILEEGMTNTIDSKEQVCRQILRKDWSIVA